MTASDAHCPPRCDSRNIGARFAVVWRDDDKAKAGRRAGSLTRGACVLWLNRAGAGRHALLRLGVPACGCECGCWCGSAADGRAGHGAAPGDEEAGLRARRERERRRGRRGLREQTLPATLRVRPSLTTPRPHCSSLTARALPCFLREAMARSRPSCPGRMDSRPDQRPPAGAPSLSSPQARRRRRQDAPRGSGACTAWPAAQHGGQRGNSPGTTSTVLVAV